MGWASSHRGDLIAALLTLCRAWYAAGRPKADAPVLGGFQEWAQTVGGVLAHAGVHGYLGNLDRLHEEADEEAQQWEGFLHILHEIYGDKPFRVAAVADLIKDRTTLAEVLPDEVANAWAKTEGSFQRRLGKAFASKTGTRYGPQGLHLVKAGVETRGQSVLWQVSITEGDKGE
ncbi:MAG: hypothetical protein NTZ05_13200 [Chloroflexi bacterium]|nr:hypothetical protein [Chloroflexota bacterium]